MDENEHKSDPIKEAIRAALEVASGKLHALLSEHELSKEQVQMIYDYFATEQRFHILDTAIRSGVRIRQSQPAAPSPFILSCSRSDFDRLRWFVENGANVNEIYCFDEDVKTIARDADDDGYTTPMDRAVEAWHSALSTAQIKMTDTNEAYLESVGAKMIRNLSEAEREANFKS